MLHDSHNESVLSGQTKYPQIRMSLVFEEDRGEMKISKSWKAEIKTEASRACEGDS